MSVIWGVATGFVLIYLACLGLTIRGSLNASSYAALGGMVAVIFASVPVIATINTLGQAILLSVLITAIAMVPLIIYVSRQNRFQEREDQRYQEEYEQSHAQYVAVKRAEAKARADEAEEVIRRFGA